MNQIIVDAIDFLADDLNAINLKIHSDPELAHKEFHAHDNIVAFLRQTGLEVVEHAYGLATSFEATYGQGGRLIVFNAEYDALPGIGHACGHNLIATSSIAAFLAVATAIKRSPTPVQGRVRLLGTPGEEGGGGKLLLSAVGAFRGVNACFLAHPISVRSAKYSGYPNPQMAANSKMTVTFRGKAAHAGGMPWAGINALDAATLAHSSISMLRQQIRPTERINGIMTRGGDRPNVIPDMTKMDYIVRAPTRRTAQKLRKRVDNCFHGAALATGCTVEFEEGYPYDDMRTNKPICSAYAEAMDQLGHPVLCDFKDPISVAGSSDQGNVSYTCPAMHAYFSLPIGDAPDSHNHTPGFTKVAETEDSFRRALIAAKGMAIVGLRVLQDDAFAESVQKDFDEDCRKREFEGGSSKL